MKRKLPGNPSCSRISHESTSATRPIPIAVIAYWIAMTFASWLQMYLPDEGLRVIELDLADLRGRREFRILVRNVLTSTSLQSPACHRADCQRGARLIVTGQYVAGSDRRRQAVESAPSMPAISAICAP